MAQPKWDLKELRLWAFSCMGIRIPKNVIVEVVKHTDAGNYKLRALEFPSHKMSYKETSEYFYRLAAKIRRSGGFASVRENDESGNLSMVIDMGGTLADINKIAQRELWG